MGRIEAIYLRPSARTPVKRVEQARAMVGSGVAGDHAGAGNRQITLLDLAAWRTACAELGVELDPGARRANVVVVGLPLARSAGKRVRLGDVVVEIVGETAPCRLLDDAAPGLMEALRPDWRAGVYGRVVNDGELTVGAAAAFED